MKLLGSSSTRIHVPARSSSLTGLAQAQTPEPPRWAARRPHITPGGSVIKPFDRPARLAELALGTPPGSVTVAAPPTASGMRKPGIPATADRQSVLEQSLLRSVIESGDRVVIDDVRLDPRTRASGLRESGDVRAWAGFPVRDPDGAVVGALCVTDHVPRTWSAGELEFLDLLSHVASAEIALQVTLKHGAERAELARTLQESLLPPRLPEIPGLRVAARYVAGGTGAEVLGDFYDVFPSVRTSWGLVVGDVCGKGVPGGQEHGAGPLHPPRGGPPAWPAQPDPGCPEPGPAGLADRRPAVPQRDLCHGATDSGRRLGAGEFRGSSPGPGAPCGRARADLRAAGNPAGGAGRS